MNTLKNRSLIGLTLVLIAVVALVALPAAAQDNNADRYPVDTISVSGSGSAAGVPDIATVEIGVETRNDDVSLAFAENSATIDAVIGALVDAGIAREDIRTSGLNIYLERYPIGMGGPEGPQDFSSTFVVNNLVRVVVRDTGAVGEVLSAAVEAGANNIYGLTFGIEDQAGLESEARVEAMANAQARAAELAQIAGVDLGDVLVISESWGGSGPFDVRNLAQAGYGGGGGAPIEPGQLSVVVEVQVTYRINR